MTRTERMTQEKQHVVWVTTIYTSDSSLGESIRNRAEYGVRQSGAPGIDD